MSRENSQKINFSSEDVRKFASERYGTLKNFAKAIGVSQPNLTQSLSGKRPFGASWRERLDEVGFFEWLSPINKELIKDELINVETKLNIDINGAIELSNTPAPRLAQLMGVSAATLDTWRTGASTPTLEQLVNLFNLTVALGLSARHAPPKPLDTAEPTDEPAAPMPPAQATA